MMNKNIVSGPGLLPGFVWPLQVACGGKEVPFTVNNQRFIYVWDAGERKHYYYCFDTDILIPDFDFHRDYLNR